MCLDFRNADSSGRTFFRSVRTEFKESFRWREGGGERNRIVAAIFLDKKRPGNAGVEKFGILQICSRRHKLFELRVDKVWST